MNSIDEFVNQNQAFINIKTFLEYNAYSNSERLLKDYLVYIARLSKTYHKKYSLNLDDIIAEALLAFAVRVGDYPNTSHFKSYNKETVCKYIRCHIINYYEAETKKEKIEKQKQQAYIKYVK